MTRHNATIITKKNCNSEIALERSAENNSSGAEGVCGGGGGGGREGGLKLF